MPHAGPVKVDDAPMQEYLLGVAVALIGFNELFGCLRELLAAKSGKHEQIRRIWAQTVPLEAAPKGFVRHPEVSEVLEELPNVVPGEQACDQRQKKPQRHVVETRLLP